MNRTFTLGLALGTALLVACGGARKGPEGDDRFSVDRLYPMREGAVWSYDVDTGQGLPILAISRITQASESRAEVTVGREAIPYERRPDGLYRPDREAYVLRAPVREGASWDAGDGVTAEVRSTTRSVDTPAGHFEGCVEVVESGGAAGKTVRTVFCPDVGPVEIESSMPMPGQSHVARVTARLRGYDLTEKKADDDGPPESGVKQVEGP